MKTKADIFYEAILARDHRFDGKFYVGVKTTGIYCRPICPARPLRRNVEFYPTARAAEKAGYRPCLRCRPECAPGSPVWSGKNATIERALKLLAQGALEALDEDALAARLGVSARHLRRLFRDDLGQTPKQLHDRVRLDFARTLIVETDLPLTEVAFASGFGSVRRFNDAVKARFKRSPSEMRRAVTPVSHEAPLSFTLAYRPPLDWQTSLEYFRRHRIDGLESVGEQSLERVFRLGDTTGWFRVSPLAGKPALKLELKVSDTKTLLRVVQRVRQMLDLDSDPLLVANAFARCGVLGSLVEKHPGLRLTRGFDPFETGVATILGQLVSREAASKLVAQLLEHYGEEIVHPLTGVTVRAFPPAAVIAEASLAEVGTTKGRRAALKEFAARVASGALKLESAQDPAAFRAAILAIKGIGPWTAEYVALRALDDTDAFPATDLIVARYLEAHPELDPDSVRPWRGYVAAHVWKESSP